jgi:hypothetical protein
MLIPFLRSTKIPASSYNYDWDWEIGFRSGSNLYYFSKLITFSMTRKLISAFCLFYGSLWACLPIIAAQTPKYYWQQEIDYKMDITLNVETNRYVGHQEIRYKNNSPDVLDKVFFHLYLNTFQPGSVMDVRSQALKDADPRVGARISQLNADEIGFQRIRKLTQNGLSASFEENGTILEVKLAKPIQPGQSVRFDMEYDAQVPVQIRRNGRDNHEGVRYSMAQWYPKLCEYDMQGWHANPYIGREFYGVWGDFDVSITLDSKYTVAASGILKNRKKIGHGYAATPKSTGKMLTWHFIAENVHDFVWAADPEYIHDVHTCADGLELHSFYKPNETFNHNWEKLLPIMEEAFNYINVHFGKYPFPVYSFIQGGDGGMEYPMATLITGHRSLSSLVGVSVHELMHSWYQMILGFNESLYYWMDEGFTQYASERVMEHLKAKGLLPGEPDPNPYESFYTGYANIVEEGIEEPLSTHADHFDYNASYSIAAYVKGAVFLHQLEYVIGKPAFDKGMLDFYNTWKFKHPDANDFIRIMEKSSGLELDWYKEYFVFTTKSIDYAVDTLYGNSLESTIQLKRDGGMPMPVDVVVALKDGKIINYTIPLDIMRGAKKEEPVKGDPFQVLPDWNWVNPGFQFRIPFGIEKVSSVSIDPTGRMADLFRDDNTWPPPKS